MSNNTQDTFEQIPYDRLTLVGKETGDYGSTEYLYRGHLGTYTLRIGQSITDNGKVLYIYANNKMFLSLYPTKTKKVFVGKDEAGEFYIFRFDGKEVNVSKGRFNF